MWAAAQHRLTIKQHAAGVWNKFAHKAVQQRGFTSAIWANDCVYRIFCHAEMDAAKGL